MNSSTINMKVVGLMLQVQSPDICRARMHPYFAMCFCSSIFVMISACFSMYILFVIFMYIPVGRLAGFEVVLLNDLLGCVVYIHFHKFWF